MNEETKLPDGTQQEQSPASQQKDLLHGGNWKTPRKLRIKKEHNLRYQINAKLMAIRIAALMTALFLLAAGLLAVLYIQMLDTEDQFHKDQSDLEHEKLLLEEEKAEALLQLADLRSERQVLLNRINEIEQELQSVKAERDELIANDAVITQLNQDIAELRAQIAEKDAEIAELQKQLLPDHEVNLQPLLVQLQEIQTLLELGAPYKTVSVKKFDEYGTPYYEDELVYPNISLYLSDPDTGLSYVWQTGNSYEIAELRHLILALAVFDCAEQELSSLPENAADPQLLYDLNKKYSLKSEDIVPGTGILKNVPAGTEYTYLDLIKIMLSYCDVTAYHIIQAEFKDAVTVFLPKIEGLSSSKQDAQMTAKDMMLILSWTYNAIRSGSPYAEELSGALTTAVSTNLSQAVSGTVLKQHAASGKGYHELGIRITEKQTYMVVVMTDLSEVTPELNSYLQNLYHALNDLIKAFA